MPFDLSQSGLDVTQVFRQRWLLQNLAPMALQSIVCLRKKNQKESTEEDKVRHLSQAWINRDFSEDKNPSYRLICPCTYWTSVLVGNWSELGLLIEDACPPKLQGLKNVLSCYQRSESWSRASMFSFLLVKAQWFSKTWNLLLKVTRILNSTLPVWRIWLIAWSCIVIVVPMILMSDSNCSDLSAEEIQYHEWSSCSQFTNSSINPYGLCSSGLLFIQLNT